MKKLKELSPILLAPIILVGIVYIYRFYKILAKIIQIESYGDYNDKNIFAIAGVVLTLLIIFCVSWKYLPD